MEYQHGGDIYSQEIRWDFSVNINPLGTPEGVKDAVRRAAEFCSVYPDGCCRRLVGMLAEYHQFPEEGILCGNGAADLIFQAVFAERPKEGWLMAPTFSEYGQAIKAVDGKIHCFSLKREENFRPDVDRLIGEWKEKAGQKTIQGKICSSFWFICNPNNPTGTAVSRKELRKLAAFAEEEHIRLVIDECFLDFCGSGKEDSMVGALKEFPHMVILKAFTKRFGMAGLRLGYCLTMDRKLLERMENTRQPWPVSTAAQMAGEAALKEKEYLVRTDLIVRKGREQLETGLKGLGFWVCPSQANFLLFQDLRRKAADGRLYRQCIEKKLLLRSCKNFRELDGSYYRVCVKTEEENKLLLDILGQAVKEM